MWILVHHPHIVNRTDSADPSVVTSTAKPLPPQAPSDYTTVLLKMRYDVIQLQRL